MKHVTLQVVQHLRPGGIEKLVLNLLQFASPGHEVYVAALEGDKASAITAWPELKPFGARLFFLGKAAGRDLKTVLKLRKLIRLLDVSVIHSHHLGPLLYSRLATFGLSVTHIQTEHDSWHLQDSKQCLITRLLLKRSKVKLVADAPRVAEQLEQRLGVKPDQVIINGIDTRHFSPGSQLLARQLLQLPAGKNIIGCAGRLVPEKGIDTLITALTKLPGYHLAVAGHGPEKFRLTEIAGQLGVSDRIHWLGHCSNMRSFYRAIDIFCMPSRQEGLPLALLEAQACGQNVIATAIGGIPDLLCPHSGRLIEPDNPEELAKALEEGLSDTTSHSEQNAQYIRYLADVRTMAASYESLAH